MSNPYRSCKEKKDWQIKTKSVHFSITLKWTLLKVDSWKAKAFYHEEHKGTLSWFASLTWDAPFCLGKSSFLNCPTTARHIVKL